MGAAYFYHLTRRPLEAVLPMLLGKSLEAGWRVYVRGTAQERLIWLDDKLWLGAEEGFLPHGVEHGDHDADQPILLGTSEKAANGANCLMCVDGAAITADEATTMERTCVIFDGNDDEALNHARSQWKALVDGGCSAQYWSEESGKWEKKAER